MLLFLLESRYLLLSNKLDIFGIINSFSEDFSEDKRVVSLVSILSYTR